MDPNEAVPGLRVEVEEIGEGTVVENRGDEVEIAVSEVETIYARPEQLIHLQ